VLQRSHRGAQGSHTGDWRIYRRAAEEPAEEQQESQRSRIAAKRSHRGDTEAAERSHGGATDVLQRSYRGAHWSHIGAQKIHRRAAEEAAEEQQEPLRSRRAAEPQRRHRDR
jgi:hypothetical protein